MQKSKLGSLDSQEKKDNSIDIREIEEALSNGFFDKKENIVALQKEMKSDEAGLKGLRESLKGSVKKMLDRLLSKSSLTLEEEKIIDIFGEIVLNEEKHNRENISGEISGGNFYINGQKVDKQEKIEIKEKIVPNELYLSRVEFLGKQIDFVINDLLIQANTEITGMKIVDNALDRKERKEIERIVLLLQNKKKEIEGLKLISFLDFGTFKKGMDSFVKDFFSPLLNSKKLSPQKRKTYGEIASIFENISIANANSAYSAEKIKKADDVFLFSKIQGELALKSRLLVGIEGFENQQKQLEDYIINYGGFKDPTKNINLVWEEKQKGGEKGVWKTRENNGQYITGVFEFYKNMIESPLQNGDTKEIDTFIRYAESGKFEKYLSDKLGKIGGNVIEKTADGEERLLNFWESLPSPYKKSLIVYLRSGYKKISEGLEKEKEETKKTVKKELGKMIAIKYLSEKNLDFNPSEKKRKNKIEDLSDEYLENGTFQGTDLEKYETNFDGEIKNYEKVIEKALEDGKKIAMMMLLKKTVVKGTMSTYANTLLYGGVKGNSSSNMLEIHNATKTKGIDLTAQFSDNKYLQLYSESTGIGGFLNLSDAESNQIISITKSLVINIALTYASGGLASLGTKTIMGGVAWGLRAVNSGRTIIAADAITMFYQNSMMLSKTARIAMTGANMAVEGSLFHVFNTALSSVINDETDKMREGLTDIKGYAHSIAFMGIMRIFGKPGELIQKILQKAPLSPNMIRMISKGISIPLEVGAMTGTEQVLPIVFRDSAEKITWESLLQTTALVIGLRLAHRSKLFEKGDKILVEKMAPNLKFKVKKMGLTESQAKRQEHSVTPTEQLQWSRILNGKNQIEGFQKIEKLLASKNLLKIDITGKIVPLSEIQRNTLVLAHNAEGNINKARMLRLSGFSKEQVRVLMEYRVCGKEKGDDILFSLKAGKEKKVGNTIPDFDGKNYQKHINNKFKAENIENPLNGGTHEYLLMKKKGSSISWNTKTNTWEGLSQIESKELTVQIYQQSAKQNNELWGELGFVNKTALAFSKDTKMSGDHDLVFPSVDAKKLDSNGQSLLKKQLIENVIPAFKKGEITGLKFTHNVKQEKIVFDFSNGNADNIPRKKIDEMIADGSFRVNYQNKVNVSVNGKTFSGSMDTETFVESGTKVFEIDPNKSVEVDIGNGIKQKYLTPDGYIPYAQDLLLTDLSKEFKEDKVKKLKIAKRIDDFMDALSVSDSLTSKSRTIKDKIIDFIRGIIPPPRKALSRNKTEILVEAMKTSNRYSDEKNPLFEQYQNAVEHLEKVVEKHKTGPHGTQEYAGTLIEFRQETDALKKGIKEFKEQYETGPYKDEVLQKAKALNARVKKLQQYDFSADKNFAFFNEVHLLTHLDVYQLNKI